jgi:anti-sigma B factor antagonist
MVGSPFGTHAFHVRAERLNGFVRLFVSGELDLSSVENLDQSLAQLQQPGATVIVDLAGLEFMGVAGVLVLLDASRRASSTDGAVLIVNAKRSVRRVFDLTSSLGLLDSPAVAEIFEDGRDWTPMNMMSANTFEASVSGR